MTNMGKWATWWAEQEGTKLGRYGRWQHDNIRILGTGCNALTSQHLYLFRGVVVGLVRV